MKAYRLEGYILIIALILLGITSLTVGSLHIWDIPVLFPKALGAVLIVSGVFTLVFLWQKGKDKETADNASVRICPKCEEVVAYYEKQRTCPVCNIKLEPLEGFYERHPELKD